ASRLNDLLGSQEHAPARPDVSPLLSQRSPILRTNQPWVRLPAQRKDVARPLTAIRDRIALQHLVQTIAAPEASDVRFRPCAWRAAIGIREELHELPRQVTLVQKPARLLVDETARTVIRMVQQSHRRVGE